MKPGAHAHRGQSPFACNVDCVVLPPLGFHVFLLQDPVCWHPLEASTATGLCLQVLGTKVLALSGAASVVEAAHWRSLYSMDKPVALSEFDSILCCDAPAVVGLFLYSVLTRCEFTPSSLPAVYCTAPVCKEAENTVSSVIGSAAIKSCVPVTAASLAKLTLGGAAAGTTARDALPLACLPSLSTLSAFISGITKVQYGERLCWCGSGGWGGIGVCTSPGCTMQVVPFASGLSVGGCGFALETPSLKLCILGSASALVDRHPRQLEVTVLHGCDALVLLPDPLPPAEKATVPPSDALHALFEKMGACSLFCCSIPVSKGLVSHRFVGSCALQCPHCVTAEM